MFKGVKSINGNVGIGTTTPSAKLDVNGSGVLLNIKNNSNSFLFVNETSGNVGIGLTNPSQKLHVSGDMNVSGFSITDNSLVSMADGTRKMIKDIKEGDYVLSLDEKSGKIVSNKVTALLDHRIKPIYMMTTKSGRTINTTAEHPYFVKLYDKEECDKYAGGYLE